MEHLSLIWMNDRTGASAVSPNTTNRMTNKHSLETS